MEKIEKLEGSYDVPQLKQKLNEIIDHLNSQDQEEEKIVRSKEDMERTDYTGYPYSKEFQSTTWDTLEEITAEQLCEDNRKRMERLINKEMEERGFIRKIKDTPEEWEERFAEFFLYVTNDKNWVDGRPEWKGDVFVTLYNAILHFIEKHLDEKEREAEENLLKRLYSAKSKKEFRDMLDKLLNKKK